MQWVETTGKSVEEAKEIALDRLGVSEVDAEIEVLEEPRTGLFGRIRGQARVKARIRPKGPRPKQERRRRGRGSGEGRSGEGGSRSEEGRSGGGRSGRGRDDAKGNGRGSGGNGRTGGKASGGERSGGSDADRPEKKSEKKRSDETRTGTAGGDEGRGSGGSAKAERTKQERPRPKERVTMEEEAQVRTVTGFLTGLVEALGVRATATARVEDGTVHASLEGDDLGILVGPRLATLDAIQEITRNVLQREAGDRDHGKVVLDVAGVRELRRNALVDFVTGIVDRVRDEQVEVALEVMNSVDRKVVHDTVAELDGVESISEGEDPRRRVVIRPA